MAHAPHVQPNNTPSQTWWDTFHKLTEKWPPTIVFAGFNAKINGKTVTPGIGTVPPPTTQQKTEDYNASQLRLATSANDITCINTTVQHYPTHTLQKTVNKNHIATSYRLHRTTQPLDTLCHQGICRPPTRLRVERRRPLPTVRTHQAHGATHVCQDKRKALRHQQASRP